MIPTGLKFGATFEDGGLTFEVLTVNPDGSYISRRVESKKKEATPIEVMLATEEAKETKVSKVKKK